MKIDFILNAITIIGTLISLYIHFFSGFSKSQGLLVLGIISVLVVIFVTLEYFSSSIKTNFRQISNNTKKIKNLEEKLNVVKMLNELERRLGLLEKKGSLDPKVVTVFFIVVFVIIYMRMAGIF